jgi:putative ABC transport system permease protein
MGIRFVDGRGFGPEFNDSLSVVVNQRAVKALGLKQPVGSTLVNNINPTTPVTYTIVGVVEDYNYESLHLEVSPLVIMSTESAYSFQSVLVARVESERRAQAIAGIQSAYREVAPNAPFNYSFLDNRLEKLYTSEKASGNLLTTFTFIAIIVACVGLFGLTAYTANQRTKEISIRKVLGATAAGIVRLLSRDFAWLVLMALLLGAPLAWYLTGEWLQTFAFRIALSPVPFLAAGMIVFLFTAVTISYHAIRSALVNPAETLKGE